MSASSHTMHDHASLITGTIASIFFAFWNDVFGSFIHNVYADPLVTISHFLSIAVSIGVLRKLWLERRRRSGK